MYQVNVVEQATMLDFWKAERKDWYEIVFLLPVELISGKLIKYSRWGSLVTGLLLLGKSNMAPKAKKSPGWEWSCNCLLEHTIKAESL